MRHLNYSHLLYFHTVAREGSIAKASETLHITPQTISSQIKLLEEAVGAPLFDRVGRGLVLTETGQAVNHFAEEIFSLGTELAHWVKRRSSEPAGSLNVGIVNSIPKLVAYSVLQAALEADPPVKMVCREDGLSSLLADLAVHRLDLVLSDRQIPPGFNVKAFSHLLGESPISFYGTDLLASQYEPDFPQSLDGAPVLLPMHGTALRSSLDAWFDQVGIAPNVIAEFEDSALLKAFGESGAGLFPAPQVIHRQLRHTYHVQRIGNAGPVKETFYAISPERVLKQRTVRWITDSARERLSRLS
jgi:LysR family transcriptional activator of nhaA